MAKETHAISLKVQTDIYAALKKLAMEQERSVTWLINRLLSQALEKKEAKQ